MSQIRTQSLTLGVLLSLSLMLLSGCGDKNSQANFDASVFGKVIYNPIATGLSKIAGVTKSVFGFGGNCVSKIAGVVKTGCSKGLGLANPGFTMAKNVANGGVNLVTNHKKTAAAVIGGTTALAGAYVFPNAIPSVFNAARGLVFGTAAADAAAAEAAAAAAKAASWSSYVPSVSSALKGAVALSTAGVAYFGYTTVKAAKALVAKIGTAPVTPKS